MVTFFSYALTVLARKNLNTALGKVSWKVGLKDQAYLLDSLVSIKLAKNANPVFFLREKSSSVPTGFCFGVKSPFLSQILPSPSINSKYLITY